VVSGLFYAISAYSGILINPCYRPLANRFYWFNKKMGKEVFSLEIGVFAFVWMIGAVFWAIAATAWAIRAVSFGFGAPAPAFGATACVFGALGITFKSWGVKALTSFYKNGLILKCG
jgi:hypothetical protein